MNKLKLFLQRFENSSYYIFLIGIIAALFFTATFLINRAISLDGGHWFWSAFLRFLFTIIFLAIGFISFKGFSYFKLVIDEYIKNFVFWTTAGTIGFGFFYSLICYASYYSPAWVIATTFQFTIIASLFVLLFFGKKLSKSVWAITAMIFIGVTLVNISHFDMSNIDLLLLGFVPVLIASFSFPVGNQMVWEEKEKRIKNNCDILIIKNSFAKIFLLTLGSAPFWIFLYFSTDSGIPTYDQYINVALITILSGIIATSLFLYARSLCNTNNKLVLIDSTQSGDVFFALIGEIIFLNAVFPNALGIVGILITIFGLFLLVKIK